MSSLDPGSIMQHHKVFQKSLSIYVERSEVRGEAWAGASAEVMLYDCNSKLARARAALTFMNSLDKDSSTIEKAKDEAIDSLQDLINFAAFAIRHITGEKPDVEPLGYEAPDA